MDTPQPTTPPTHRSPLALLPILLVLVALGSVIVALIFVRQIARRAEELQRTTAAHSASTCTAATRALQAEQLILSRIDFSYPCGWHVVEQALVRDPARRGVVSDYIYLNPDPISFAPRDGEPSRIIVRIDEQDQFRKFPRLASLAQYVKDAEKQFVTHTTTTLAPNANGLVFTKIDGTQNIFDHTVPVVLYFTEFTDSNQPNRRMVMEIWAGNPKWEDGSVEKALKQIVETMKQI
ncbi:hypothetical protein HY624_00245 [Candidatus Uhrbacteria bacterium]|nr:hypothetical protein [Candidatus Uhrbacteria bacterium]